MDERFFAGQWPLLCQGVRSHAAVLGRLLEADAARLLAAETERFCGQAAPATADELVSRTLDQAAFARRASLVVHADAMGRLHPAVAAEVLAVAETACEADLPDTPEEAMSQSLALTHASERISRICHEDAAARIGRD